MELGDELAEVIPAAGLRSNGDRRSWRERWAPAEEKEVRQSRFGVAAALQVRHMGVEMVLRGGAKGWGRGKRRQPNGGGASISAAQGRKRLWEGSIYKYRKLQGSI